MHPGREYTIDVVDQLLSNSRSTVANSPQPQDAPGLVGEYVVYICSRYRAVEVMFMVTPN